jgi:hypothetical protein
LVSGAKQLERTAGGAHGRTWRPGSTPTSRALSLPPNVLLEAPLSPQRSGRSGVTDYHLMPAPTLNAPTLKTEKLPFKHGVPRPVLRPAPPRAGVMKKQPISN